MRAVVASLFDLEIEEVPNFIALPEDSWFRTWRIFWNSNGYSSVSTCRVKGNEENAKAIMKMDGGVNGYFFGVVDSQTFPGECTHAVVIDSNMNIVHDPNPNGLALRLRPEDVLDVMVKGESINNFFKK